MKSQIKTVAGLFSVALVVARFLISDFKFEI